MWPFARKESKSTGPLVALSDLAAASWSGTAALSRQGFERNTVAYRCVRLIAEAAASVPFSATSEDHGLRDLLRYPNSGQAGPDLMETFYGHVLISGDGFLEAVQLDGEVRELFALRPDRMKMIAGARGYPHGWEHRVGSEVRRIGRQADGFLPVLHLKLFHPQNDYSGQSPLEAAARAIDIHNAGGAWAKALMDNAARPSGALIYSGAEALTQSQLSDLRSDLEGVYQGANNAGRPMILQGGLDWKPMSLSPAEMDFVDARHMAAREIAMAFGVPPMLLGIPGDATYANYREANSAFWRLTVLPLVDRAARAISGWLKRRLDGSVAPDLENVPAFQEERAAQWSRIDAASFLTVDEKRALAGLPPPQS